jgi:NAD(P)H-flavin reductase/Pyruvate/2-oxoacid:ferredoxin oxidoreductase delta subunit
MSSFHIKTNRTFTLIRKYGFIFTLTVAVGGLWYPKLGLLVIPVIIGLILYSFFKGRFWCGNICAHGSLFDSVFLRWSRNTHIPSFFRNKWLGILFFGWFSAKLITKFIKVAGVYGSASFFDKIGMIFVGSYLMVTILGGTLALFFAPRTWCNFCPMGFMQRLSYRLGKKLGVTTLTDEKVTASRTEMCHSCGKCARVCPMQLTPYTQFTDKNQFDDEACIRCSTCVENCPAHILTLTNEKTADVLKKNVSIEGYENRQRIHAVVETVKALKEDVTEYTFKFIEPERVAYKAGQFILVKIKDDPEMFRAYSISSFNEDGKRLSVTIKRVPNGYGTGLISQNFKTDDEIILEGPMGRDIVVDKTTEKVLLIGGGIGITPFVPIVRDLVENPGSVKEFKLLYGANKVDELIYSDAFEAFETASPAFEFRKIIAFDDAWTGRKGFVTDHMEDIDLSEYKVYMCGPPPMVGASIKKLESLGVQAENIKYESA